MPVEPAKFKKRCDRAKLALKEVFGHDGYRPFQQNVIEGLLNGEDVFAVAATGGGKALTFQLPALVLPGVAVVISPLIALMKDQVDKLNGLGVAAVRLTSDLERTSSKRALSDCNIVYVSPEKAKTTEFKKALRGVQVSMFALDECHTATRWCDFRPSYAALGDILDEHEEAVRLACTATADVQVEEDVNRLFRLRSPRRVVGSPWRENIEWQFCRDAGDGDLIETLKPFTREGSQIVYVASRREAERVADTITSSGITTAMAYHAGMEATLRTRIQQEFLAGTIPCIVATSAFGMGIDKAQPLWSKVLTPAGWRRIGDLSVGDEVVAADGSATRVVATHERGRLPAFRVTFDDGASTVCADDHRWAVITPKERMRGHAYAVKRLSDIRGCLRDRAGNRLIFIPLVDPVVTHPAPLTLDPYLLGALLGDGGMSTRAVKFTTADAWMVREVRRLVPQPVRVRLYGCYSFGLVHSKGRRNPVRAALDDLGLRGAGSHTKFVPDAYLQASAKDRLSLLQGLFDTDGSVAGTARTSVMYVTVSDALRDAVVHLTRSLGGLATFARKAAAWYVSVRLPCGVAPFRLPKKRRRYRMRTKYQLRRSVESVVPCGDETMRCITVAHPSGLYVTDDFIVTHNSDIRCVANWQLPASLFDLLQQTGRASRDGKYALGWVNLGAKAERSQRFFVEMSNPPFKVYEKLWAKFVDQDKPSRWTADILLRVAGVVDPKWSSWMDSALSYLEFTGHIGTTPAGISYRLPINQGMDGFAAKLCDSVEHARIKDGAVRYDVPPGSTDHHATFLRACSYTMPSHVVIVKTLKRKLDLTEGDIDDKKAKASDNIDQITEFAQAANRQAFVERVFART